MCRGSETHYLRNQSLAQLVHGCRQFVPQGVGLILETNATLILCYYVIGDCPGNREEGVDDVKSSCYLREGLQRQYNGMVQSEAMGRPGANL